MWVATRKRLKIDSKTIEKRLEIDSLGGGRWWWGMNPGGVGCSWKANSYLKKELRANFVLQTCHPKHVHWGLHYETWENLKASQRGNDRGIRRSGRPSTWNGQQHSAKSIFFEKGPGLSSLCLSPLCSIFRTGANPVILGADVAPSCHCLLPGDSPKIRLIFPSRILPVKKLHEFWSLWHCHAHRPPLATAWFPNHFKECPILEL